jgi:DNA-binding NtrC family response regulator
MPATNVLVVEDEGIVALDLARRLAAQGYTVIGPAESGAEALELAERAPPDLVLMDVRLKGPTDGIAAAEEMRRRWQLPVIYLTAYADEATLARARVTEPFAYVLKPFGERELRTAIEMTLYRSRLERERADRLRFESLATDLLARLSRVEPEALHSALTDALQQVVECLDVDRATIWLPTPDNQDVVMAHSYSRPEYETALNVSPRTDAPWLWERALRGEVIAVGRVDDLHTVAPLDEASFRRLRPEVKSMLAIPIVIAGRVEFGLSINAIRHERTWPPELVSRLRLLTEVMANTLARHWADAQLREALAEVSQLKEQLQAENVYLREELEVQHSYEEIVGKSEAIRRSLLKVEQVAPLPTTVLLLGETGTGKELFARAIHAGSPRRDRPMIKVNCAALPVALIESELFGREKGAFTGALTRQAGRFELAHGSTLFLDEMGDLPLETQAKLLRALQEGEFERLGGTQTIKVDVRVIAATNRALEQAVKEGKFREDLYYRLNVFPIRLPPLRERPEDIPLLVWSFVKEFEQTMGKAITTVPRACLEALQRHPWPGNVRQLRNVIEHAMIVCPGPALRIDLPAEGGALAGAGPAESLTLQDVERRHILSVLETTGWRVSGKQGAAAILGLKATTLEARMAKLGIKRQSH